MASFFDWIVRYSYILRLLTKSETAERWIIYYNKLQKHSSLEKYRSKKLATLTQPAVYRDTFSKYPSQLFSQTTPGQQRPCRPQISSEIAALELCTSFQVFQNDTVDSETSENAQTTTTTNRTMVQQSVTTVPTDGRPLSANESSTATAIPTQQFALPSRVVVPQFNYFVVQRNLYQDNRQPSTYVVAEQQRISRWTDTTDFIPDQRYLDMIHLHNTKSGPFQVGDLILFLYSLRHQLIPSDPLATLILCRNCCTKSFTYRELSFIVII
jgi:hypothetical protein